MSSSQDTPAKLLLIQSQGALRAEALYIEREADEALFQALCRGEFAYVLAPRQIGKSSLRVRTARRLAEEGTHCAEIDLSILGGAADNEVVATWYFSLMSAIAHELKLPDPGPFCMQHASLGPAHRFACYLREEVLARLPGAVTIFLDEIDYLRSLQVPRDELFAVIRGILNERARHAAYKRLTFCLLGVAAPGDLIENPEITPFNIGHPIELTDFSRQEINAFAPAIQALPGGFEAQAQWFDAIYSWTSGHPYMTARLLEELLSIDAKDEVDISACVGRTVKRLFLRRGRAADSNLSYAERRLGSQQNQRRLTLLLSLYQRLLDEEVIDAAGGDALQNELLLCGLAVPRQEADGYHLRIRNRIFAAVFDLEWVRSLQSRHEWSEALMRWQGSGKVREDLLRGELLHALNKFVIEHPTQANPAETEFLFASLEDARRQAESSRLTVAADVERERQELAKQTARWQQVWREQMTALLNAEKEKREQIERFAQLEQEEKEEAQILARKERQRREALEQLVHRERRRQSELEQSQAKEKEHREKLERRLAEETSEHVQYVLRTSSEIAAYLDSRTLLMQKAEHAQREYERVSSQFREMKERIHELEEMCRILHHDRLVQEAALRHLRQEVCELTDPLRSTKPGK